MLHCGRRISKGGGVMLFDLYAAQQLAEERIRDALREAEQARLLRTLKEAEQAREGRRIMEPFSSLAGPMGLAARRKNLSQAG